MLNNVRGHLELSRNEYKLTIFVFCSTGIEPQDLAQAKQVLYHLSYSTSPSLYFAIFSY